MEFRDVNYFHKLVELKSFKETANYFKVSQPAISAMVKRLEKEIGCPLVFQQSSRSKLTITPAGLVVYKQAKKLLSIENVIKLEAKRASESKFKLGYSELAGKTWLSSIITQLNRGHLLASVETFEENSHFLEQHLRDGKYDAILFTRLENEMLKGINLTNLTKFHYNLIVPANSSLAQKDEIDLFEIRDIPLILRHKRFLSRTALEQIFAKSGFKPKRKLIVDSIDATIQLISKGMGVGYLMNISVKNHPEVKAIPLIPSQQIDCYSCLAVREEFSPNQVQKECLNIIKNLNL
ncbi:DNA-binding transcriptional LysR family regulator [Lactobacillus colini]|uniref:DNA-binding transcriptional LysR family regulator n=1 Tax=Lactobacillus colini TaxID=1819254 RepID=A0ABS4MBZ1_9LACO|nr:LysR family transcriptional regulator [Lactobacillus colini]MBP2057204.1 DNA-binding transcriptional LysR family regulator [Lactobacillus colini]